MFLSLGGNDILHHWHKDMSDEETEVVLDSIVNHIEEVINQLNTSRKNLDFVIAGYDYANFDLLVNNELFDSYIDAFNDMGKPSPEELNGVIIKLNFKLQELAIERDDLYFVPTLGLNQSLLGYEEYGYAPGDLPLPNAENIVGGDPLIPQPRDALLNIQHTNLVDPYHLGRKGFSNYAKHILEIKLLELLKK